MRWLYLDANNTAEAAYRARTITAIARWWQEFAGKTQALDALFSGQGKWDLPAWMRQSLGAIDPRLMWEYGPALKTPGHRLVITPEASMGLRPLVRTILERAPCLPGWEFYPYRPPDPAAHVAPMVEARVGGSVAGYRVCPAVGRFNRIDLLYEAPGCAGPDDKSCLHRALVATETLLGEERLDQWVGTIEVTPPGGPKPGQRPVALERLGATVEAVISSMTEQLPAAPWFRRDRENMEWSTMQGQPAEQDDYSGSEDIAVVITPDPQLWLAAHRNPAFYSQRFSRHGERFCFLKIECAGPQATMLTDRAVLEDALDQALAPAAAGCTLGGGTGLRYAYIDLALADVPRGIELIRGVLQEGKVSRRSWLLFHDAELAGEWVGVYHDSPAPPARGHEEDQ